MKMIYLAAHAAAALLASIPPTASLGPSGDVQTLHGLNVYTKVIPRHGDEPEAVKAFQEDLDAHYEAGWRDTPTEAYDDAPEILDERIEGAAEAEKLKAVEAERDAALARIAAVEDNAGGQSLEDFLAGVDSEVDRLNAALKSVTDERDALKAAAVNEKTAPADDETPVSEKPKTDDAKAKPAAKSKAK